MKIYLQFITVYLFMSSYCRANDVSYEKFANDAHEILDAPLIIPTVRDVTIKPGKDASFKCLAKDPITWQPWRHFEGQFRIEHSYKSELANTPYEAVLHLSNIVVDYVGNFYCVKNETYKRYAVEIDELEESFQATRITLFVDDPEHPIAVRSLEQSLEGVTRYTHAFIPCKPTTKSIKVELYDKDSFVIINEAYYDPSQGYLIYSYQNTKYSCKVKGKDDTLKDFYVPACAVSKIGDKAKIFSKTGSFGTESEELKFSCDVQFRGYYPFTYLNWHLPGDRKIEEDNRIETTETASENLKYDYGNVHGMYTSNMTIKNLDIQKDSGIYKCHVKTNGSTEYTDDEMRIKVLGKGVGLLYLYEPNDKLEIVTNFKENVIKLRVAYRGYPKPELTWFNNQNKEIKTSADDEKYSVEIGTSQTVLTIKNPMEEDLGVYKLKAKNSAVEKEFSITLLRSE